MKKIAIIFGLILLFLNSCNCNCEKPVPHQEKTVYNLCEISSYLGIHGEINGSLHGSFFLGIGSISGGMNGRLDDVPKAFCVLEQNGNVEIKSIPMDQLSIMYINDSTQQRVEAYRYYETRDIGTLSRNIGTLYYDYSDIKKSNLNNYIKVNTFNNMSNYNCYSVHGYRYYGDGEPDGFKNYIRTGIDGSIIYPSIDPNTAIYYKIYILEKNIAHLSNMKNLSK